MEAVSEGMVVCSVRARRGDWMATGCGGSSGASVSPSTTGWDSCSTTSGHSLPLPLCHISPCEPPKAHMLALHPSHGTEGLSLLRVQSHLHSEQLASMSELAIDMHEADVTKFNNFL